MPPAPQAPIAPHVSRPKSVTFCTRCNPSQRDVRYYSDPGRTDKLKPKDTSDEQTNEKIQGYYSEPDAKYFEIDYEFLKELRRIAKHNCPKCKKKRNRKSNVKSKSKSTRHARVKDSYVYCNGRYHSDREHCQLCCKVCNRSTDTLDSIDDEYSLVSRSYSLPSKVVSSSKLKQRKNSVQSIKSVSFLESSNDESRQDEPNYTAKSFTNDLKQFLLKPAPPRLSLKDKFIISFKQEFEATKKSPKLKAIKGLWKSY